MIGLVVAVMTTTMMMMLATLSPASGQGSPLLSPMPPAAAGAGSPGRRLRRARGSAWHTAMQLHCSFSDTTTRSCRRAGGPRPPGATGAARGLAGSREAGQEAIEHGGLRVDSRTWDASGAPEAARERCGCQLSGAQSTKWQQAIIIMRREAKCPARGWAIAVR